MTQFLLSQFLILIFSCVSDEGKRVYYIYLCLVKYQKSSSLIVLSQCVFLLHFPCPSLPPPQHRILPLNTSFLCVDLIFIWPLYHSSLNKATQSVYGKRKVQHHNRPPHASKLSFSKLVFTKPANFRDEFRKISLSSAQPPVGAVARMKVILNLNLQKGSFVASEGEEREIW